jgi:hypothetical protein
VATAGIGSYSQGGALCVHADLDTAILDGCLFQENSAQTGGAIQGLRGATVTHCRFIGNTASGVGGASYGSYGSTFVECEFVRNHSDDRGGAIFHPDNTQFIGCRFLGNSAGYGGGAIGMDGARDWTVANCAFVGNWAEVGTMGRGGAIDIQAKEEVTIANCTFVSNHAATEGGAVYQYYPLDISIDNCVFWGNTNSSGNLETSQIGSFGQQTVVRWSCIQGGWTGPGNNNIDTDPAFVRNPDPGPDALWGTEDDDYGDVRLQGGSPCIDAADNDAVPADLSDLDGDGDVTEPLPMDLAGLPRFVDDPGTSDTGNGTPPVVDMGAYEFQSGTPADSDGDGDVDKDDLRAFDACASACIIANVNGDAAGVNVMDLQFVKNNMFCADERDAACAVSDVNRDGNVNVLDLQAVKNATFCSDTSAGVTPGCEWADLDGDGDIDQDDYSIMLGCYSGANIPADPNCTN